MHVVVEDGAGHDSTTEETEVIGLHGVQSVFHPGEGAKGRDDGADAVAMAGDWQEEQVCSQMVMGTTLRQMAALDPIDDRQAVGSIGACRKSTV